MPTGHQINNVHPTLLFCCYALLSSVLCSALLQLEAPFRWKRRDSEGLLDNTILRAAIHSLQPILKQCFSDNIKQHNCCSLSRTFFFATKQRSNAFEQLSSSSVAAPRAILRQDSFATSIIYLCPKLFLKIFLVWKNAQWLFLQNYFLDIRQNSIISQRDSPPK